MAIIVNRAEKDTFDTIVKLVDQLQSKGSNIPQDILKVSLTYRNSTPLLTFGEGRQSETFELDSGNGISEQEQGDNQSKLKIGANGGPWFAMFNPNLSDAQSRQVDVGGARWNNFIESITKRFHETYSFLEYRQSRDRDALSRAQQNDIAYIQNIFESADLHYQCSNAVIGKRIDLYGATIKIGITDGPREESTILAKIVFNYNGSEFEPLLAEAAQKVLERLQGFNDQEEDANNPTRGNSENIKNDILTAMDMFLDNNDIARNICLANKKDKDTIEYLVTHGPNGVVNLTCKNVKLLSIFHCEWDARSYVVGNAGKDLYECVFGISNKISIKCLNCQRDIVVDGVFAIDRDKKYDVDRLDNTETKEALKKLFAQHSFTVCDCSELNIRNPYCNRVRCISQCTNVEIAPQTDGEEAKKIRVCRDCPYPEVLSCVNGEIMPTANLKFDKFKLELVPGDSEMTRCDYCGRSFVSDGENGTCPLCRKLYAGYGAEKEAGERLYKAYGYMLPLVTRVFGKSPKLCVEDDELIMFRLGDKIYKFDKSNMTQKFLSVPQRIKR